MRPLVIAVVLLASATAARGADSGPVAAPQQAPPPAAAKPTVTAEMRYNEGEAFAREQQWKFAESAYTEATKLKPGFPEAWNGLGHARKMQRKFPDASAGFSRFDASIDPPLVAPAPTIVWISSMNKIAFGMSRSALSTAFKRSSKSPR